MSADPRLVIFARYWNDMDWLAASLEHIEAWSPDAVVLSEGCWDSKRPARSIDGTREHLEEYVKVPKAFDVRLIDNLRDGEYRVNQANTCNKAMHIANVRTGDYVMIVDCDFFYTKEAIRLVHAAMRTEQYDFMALVQLNFWDSTKLHFPRYATTCPQVPQKIGANPTWIPTCELLNDGAQVSASPAKCASVVPIQFHYEGMRMSSRLVDKYGVADRKSPVVWKGGVKLKNRKSFSAQHPIFARLVLRSKGYDV